MEVVVKRCEKEQFCWGPFAEFGKNGPLPPKCRLPPLHTVGAHIVEYGTVPGTRPRSCAQWESRYLLYPRAWPQVQPSRVWPRGNAGWHPWRWAPCPRPSRGAWAWAQPVCRVPHTRIGTPWPMARRSPFSFLGVFFARRHILSPVKTVRSNLHCKTTLQQNPVGRVTRWMPLTPLGQCRFGCSAPQDSVGRPPAHEGVIYAIYHEC